MKNKYKLLIFDLDGVLLNSKNNMRLSWNYVRKKNKINSLFNDYFSFIGLPFEEILKKLNVNSNHEKIKKMYSKTSLKNIKKVKPFPGVIKNLKNLKKIYKLAIVTSKDALRTKYFIKKLKINFDYVSCPAEGLRGKPYPDQINLVLKKLKISNKYTLYVGDTIIDYKCAKLAKVKFIYAKYGFQKINFKKNIINSFSELNKFL